MRRRVLPVAFVRRPWQWGACTFAAALLATTGLAQAREPRRDPTLAPSKPVNSFLEADQVSYDKDTDTIIATGHVEIERERNILLADKVTFDRTRDVATATGNVTLIEPNGTAMFVQRIDVSSDLKQAIASDLRVLLDDKSRMTSQIFRRVDQNIDEFYVAAYTACDVCADKAPVWRLRANTIERDIDKRMVYYHGVWLDFLGHPVFYSPYLATPDPTAGRKSGLLMPSMGGSTNMGIFYGQPYYINIAPDKDATIEPLITSAAGKGFTAEYREDFEHGRITMFGSAMADDPANDDKLQGHIQSTARWDIDDNWRSGANVNLASNQTYIWRYNLEHTNATWLTTNAYVERFEQNSYFSVNNYYFQRQRDVIAEPSPLITPLVSYNYITDPLPWGGYLQFDGSGVVLTRNNGSDTDRLSGTFSYNLPFTTAGGNIFNARLSFRGDGYYISDYVLPTTGKPFTGTVGRADPEASLEWRLPFVRIGDSTTQILEPIAMIVSSPIGNNPVRIPNEDGLDFEFSDANLFSPDRFPGYDRVDGGTRIDYGLHWALYNSRGGTISALFGQSYRFNESSPFQPLSGLYDKESDYVGRIDVSPNQYMSFQYRFRLDKDTLAPRRTELTANLGSDVLRVSTTYLNVTPIDASGSLLNIPKELFTAISTKFSERWGLAADHRQDLGPGGGSIGTDARVTYEDECFLFSLTMSRNNTSYKDFKSGIGIFLNFTLKTIGDIRINTDVNQ